MDSIGQIEMNAMVSIPLALIPVFLTFVLLMLQHPPARKVILKDVGALFVSFVAIGLIVSENDFLTTGALGYFDDLLYLAVLVGAMWFGLTHSPEDREMHNPVDGGAQ